MKLVHLSDLHIGKRVNGFSMLEDQEYVLNYILGIVEDERADAVLIAGDVYDKAVPSADAVRVFDSFLTGLSRVGASVFIISGNHDSAERIAFGGKIMENSGVFVSPVYDGEIRPVTLSDEFGKVDFYLLPFIKPANVRAKFPEAEIESYTDAVRFAIEVMDIDKSRRNVLVAHQFVTGSQRCESEEISVGGCDNVDAEVFDAFDYTALGHLHGPQSVGREYVRYCGTPLKYSFSECSHKKSVTICELGEKGCVEVRKVPIKTMRDMREIRGSYMEVTSRAFYEGTRTDDYLRVILTDEEDIPNAVGRLRSIYPNLMRLDYDNIRTRADMTVVGSESDMSPIERFSELYKQQNNKPLSSEQKKYIENVMETVWEEV